jgi:CobQ-like glutamine amidotransferase family enzyme
MSVQLNEFSDNSASQAAYVDRRGDHMTKKIVIAHLYPSEMNIYGDMGNVITLVKRLEWRGIGAEVRNVEVGQPFNFDECDLIFGGGGQDSGQQLVAADLLRRGNTIRQLAHDTMPMLLICGLYQLFGHGFTLSDGQELQGIEVFAANTVGGSVRMIGNITVDSPFGRLVGFENHSGQTILDRSQEAIGKVIKGFGNNPTSHVEGAITFNAIGTYMHGPVLPKNPAMADHLLLAALTRKYGDSKLSTIDDGLARSAASVANARPQ